MIHFVYVCTVTNGFLWWLEKPLSLKSQIRYKAPPLGKWLYPKSDRVAMWLISGLRAGCGPEISETEVVSNCPCVGVAKHGCQIESGMGIANIIGHRYSTRFTVNAEPVIPCDWPNEVDKCIGQARIACRQLSVSLERRTAGWRVFSLKLPDLFDRQGPEIAMFVVDVLWTWRVFSLKLPDLFDLQGPEIDMFVVRTCCRLEEFSVSSCPIFLTGSD